MIDRVPAQFRGVADGVVAVAAADPRFLAVIVNGSVANGQPDEWSDLDLVVVCADPYRSEVVAQGKDFAAAAGPLLVAFTGEHVGEPRLLIALYGPPVIHVDLKFMGLGDLGERVEDGLVLWQRHDSVQQQLDATSAAWPQPDAQWIEDRFWVWIHYVAAKIGRGELFEAVDGLGMIRSAALVPSIVARRTDRPTGVRRIEQLAPEMVPALARTVAMPDRADCLRALRAAVELYVEVRGDDVVQQTEAEKAVLGYLDGFPA
ncbi:aminoglycoside 6-adenylyltransferase [Kribbella sp. DT2]|uniref:aminoglycoside 6-adenylyltransferase n=1 Tax=Kribbella sp. DT2 TaxID=3393427 RepID=UPI003CF4BF8C